MRCEQIQEQLLTEYLDEQISAEQKHVIDLHLNGCRACQEFYQAVVQAAVNPLKNSELYEAPSVIWDAVEQRIIHEDVSVIDLLRNWCVEFGNRLILPVPALGITMVIVFSLLGLMVFQSSNQRMARQAQEEPVEYLVSMIDDITAVDTNGGYGTDIEEYFL
ncbi:MAG: zf-HC2 domain-containing protein [Candidatus Omnitrophica bacterium]|nr:zf-HC2 domain-containing protein [Candidatus Omnitrophota bacterium]